MVDIGLLLGTEDFDKRVQVGSAVICNLPSRYVHTNNKTICIIRRIRNSTEFMIRPVWSKNYNCNATDFTVDMKDFDLIETLAEAVKLIADKHMEKLTDFSLEDIIWSEIGEISINKTVLKSEFSREIGNLVKETKIITGNNSLAITIDGNSYTIKTVEIKKYDPILMIGLISLLCKADSPNPVYTREKVIEYMEKLGYKLE